MDEQVRQSLEGTIRYTEVRATELRKRIAADTVQLKELHQHIQTTRKLLSEGASWSFEGDPAPTQQLALVLSADAPRSESKRFAFLSTRWAILCLLSESNARFSASEIADALKAGGINTVARDFANNVWSVLSQMKARVNPEVETTDGTWAITDTGRSAWSHISTKQQARLRHRRVSKSETPDVTASGAPLRKGEF